MNVQALIGHTLIIRPLARPGTVLYPAPQAGAVVCKLGGGRRVMVGIGDLMTDRQRRSGLGTS